MSTATLPNLSRFIPSQSSISAGLACVSFITIGSGLWQIRKIMHEDKKTNCFITATEIIRRLIGISFREKQEIIDDRLLTKPRNVLDEFWGKYSNFSSSNVFRWLTQPGHFAFYINLIRPTTPVPGQGVGHALVIEKLNGMFIIHQSFQGFYDEDMWAGRKPWTSAFHKDLFKHYGNSRLLNLSQVKDFMNTLVQETTPSGIDPKNLPFYVKMFTIPRAHTRTLIPATAVGAGARTVPHITGALAQNIRTLELLRQIVGPHRWRAIQQRVLA